jgi:hypothetical protein
MYEFNVTLDLPSEQAVEKLREALQSEQLGIVSDLDVQAIFKAKMGKDIPAYRILVLREIHGVQAEGGIEVRLRAAQRDEVRPAGAVDGGDHLRDDARRPRALEDRGAVGNEFLDVEVAVRVDERQHRVGAPQPVSLAATRSSFALASVATAWAAGEEERPSTATGSMKLTTVRPPPASRTTTLQGKSAPAFGSAASTRSARPGLHAPRMR